MHSAMSSCGAGIIMSAMHSAFELINMHIRMHKHRCITTHIHTHGEIFTWMQRTRHSLITYCKDASRLWLAFSNFVLAS